VFGHEQVVADQLYFSAKFGCHMLPSGPVIFGEAIFEGHDGDWRTNRPRAVICSEVRADLSDFLKTYFPLALS